MPKALPFGSENGPTPGRKPGSLTKASIESREFSQSIVCTRWYKASLIKRIRANTLAPAVEVLINHYARGKPPDRVSLSREDFDELRNLKDKSNEELAREAAELSKIFLENTAPAGGDNGSNGNGNGGKVM